MSAQFRDGGFEGDGLARFQQRDIDIQVGGLIQAEDRPDFPSHGKLPLDAENAFIGRIDLQHAVVDGTSRGVADKLQDA